MQTDLLALGLPTPLQDWVLTYLVHSTLLLLGVWLVTRLFGRMPVAWHETLWRVALLGGIVTAALQVAVGYESWSGRVAMARVTEAQPPIQTQPELELELEPETALVAEAEEMLLLPPPASVAPVSAGGATSRVPWSAWFATAWLLGVVAVTVRRARGRRGLARRLEDRTPVDAGPLRATLDDLLTQASLRRPLDLSAAEGIGSPIALGTFRPEIVVPTRAVADLQPAQQEAMLAHELAHHVRRDPLWLALVGWTAGLLFFQPLNHLARRKLRDTAELLADGWAVAHTGRNRELAECLTVVAGWIVGGAARIPVSAMAQVGSQLERRVERLLRSGHPVRRASRRMAWALAALPLALVAVLAPAVTSEGRVDTHAHTHEPLDAIARYEGPQATPLRHQGSRTPAVQLDLEIRALENELGALLDLLAQIEDAPTALRQGVLNLRGRLAALKTQRDALAPQADAPTEMNR